MTPKAVQVPPRKVLSLKLRVRRYYTDNPTEELTHTGLRDKFGIGVNTCKWLIQVLTEEGFIESVHVIRLRTQGIAKEPA